MGEMAERMLRGALYRADDPDLARWHSRARRLCARLDALDPDDAATRRALLEELLGFVGEGVEVRPGLRCDYGRNVSIGAGTFVNFDCVMLDVVAISIGRACQIAPRVQLLTATHPIDPGPRRDGWELGEPIAIADNVWLGGGAIVCPGVSIGPDTVVGAGAVVTRDLPGGVVAAGVPARALREIGPEDAVSPPA